MKSLDDGRKINVFGFEFKSLKTIMPGATMYNPMLSAMTDRLSNTAMIKSAVSPGL